MIGQTRRCYSETAITLFIDAWFTFVYIPLQTIMSNPTQQSSPPSNQQPQRPAYTSQSSQQGRSSVPSPYPYGAYVAQSPGIYGSPQVSGAYPYQSTYTPGMPGYGAWPVFNYTSQTAQQGARPTPARQTTVQPIPVAPGASTPTVASTPQPPSLQTRFSAHGSSNVRETAAPATGRGRKQASKGLFTKERMIMIPPHLPVRHTNYIFHSQEFDVCIW